MKVVGALLAAGSSRRLGEPKQLLRFDDGTSLLRQAAQTMLESQLNRLCVVVPPHLPDVARAVSDLELDLLASSNPAEGIAASIRVAAEWATLGLADALLLCVCDQPLLTSQHLNCLLQACEGRRVPAASFYAGKSGVPAVFPRDYLPALSQLRGDEGAAKLLRTASELALVAWPEGAEDLDSPADVARFRARRAAALR